MWLNTRVAPFDNVDARRAIAFATDRAELARLTAASGRSERATCQMLPPNSRGYVPFCPYTQRPEPASAASPPDLDRARRLVARSGTAGTSVEVHVPSEDAAVRSTGRWFVRQLRLIGYTASLAAQRFTAS